VSRFDEWLQSQINRPDHVGNVAFEAECDPDWPRGADGPGAIKRYLLEERGIFSQKIYDAVDAAWNQFDKEEVEDWKAEGGWLHELADDTAPWVKAAMEAAGTDDPGQIVVGPDGEVVPGG
jgi:hypothetical protein